MIKLINLLKEIILEARYQDIEVVPAKDIQRGASDSEGTSFNIVIGNPGAYYKMEQTPMGRGGTIQLFAGDGPGKGLYKQYKWDAKTTQLTVWNNINYIILSKENEVHWYNGKIPGGSFGVQKSSSGEKDSSGTDIKTGQSYSSQSPNKPLSELTITEFGYKVYKALLLEPSVKYIISNKSATDAIKGAVYSKLIIDPDFIWISAGGTGGLDYDEIIIINPKYADVAKVKENFENKYVGAKFYYSKNFSKQ